MFTAASIEIVKRKSNKVSAIFRKILQNRPKSEIFAGDSGAGPNVAKD